MCIICIKKRGIEFPSVKIVETMCENNPDGFSMVVSDGSKAKRFRTMDKQLFIERYRIVLKTYDYRKTSMFIHARIKTHGSNRRENCHGWRENGLIFAHNGILSIANRGDLTDSETFFRDIFSPAYRVGGWKRGEKAIEAIIGTSKFVFMNDNGDIKHYGHYIEDGGLLYSNSTYIHYDRYPRFTPPIRYKSWWERELEERDCQDLPI